MLKLFCLLFLTALVMQAIPAFAGTTVFHLSATMPEHIMTGGSTALDLHNANFLMQTQMVMRNNKNVMLQSIVVA